MNKTTPFLVYCLSLVLCACQPIQPVVDRPSVAAIDPQQCKATVGQPNRDVSETDATLPTVLHLVEDDEPGERLVITGMIYAEDCVTPLASATLYVWQANAAGIYTNLEGLLRTDQNGSYELHTIKPGYYAGERNPPPLHIHFRVTHPNAVGIESELLFADDPIYLAISRDTSTQVVRVEKESVATDVQWRGVYHIVLKGR